MDQYKNDKHYKLQVQRHPSLFLKQESIFKPYSEFTDFVDFVLVYDTKTKSTEKLTKAETDLNMNVLKLDGKLNDSSELKLKSKSIQHRRNYLDNLVTNGLKLSFVVSINKRK